jgi:acetoacetyl-CoA synthetase
MVKEGDLLWTPGTARVEQAELTRFQRWLEAERGLRFEDYDALWRWSVDRLEDFWLAIHDFYDIRFSTPAECVLADATMPGARWFPGARLNFAEHVLRRARAGEPALFHAAENRPLTTIPWDGLVEQVTRLAARLRELGVRPGDRVVSFMPNIPQTAIAFLAAASVGAIWSSCSTDFGVRSVLDRFQQIEPKFIFCVDGYRYGGKDFDRREEARQVVDALPTLGHVVWCRLTDAAAAPPAFRAGIAVHEWDSLLATPAAGPLEFEQVAFDHPLWVVYSSGTTGLPKALVHGHGGITLELHKGLGLHCNLRPGSTMFFYSTSGWIMWNLLIGSLITGASAVIYDGHPASPDIDILWRLASETGATLFGASPTYVGMMQKAGVIPRERYGYQRLEGILLSGSPVTPESMQWLYENVASDLWVTSQSGGTDVAAGFVSGAVTLPVFAGEIQVRGLGVDVQAWNDAGEPVVDEVGELVVCQPMPSMPLYFWNDPEMGRYRESYFSEFPGRWRHGDFFKVNARGGCYIQGRSDSTLNRYGVRIGTAEIYRSVETVPGVEDSLIVNLDLPGGRFFMPMFVKLAPGLVLDDALTKRINDTLREQCSPRHVPDRLYQVEAVPYTLTGKKLEVPVRRILMGFDVSKAVSRDAMMNPASIDWFIDFARERRDYSL